jgi:UDP-N-acetylglucosamine enolpyruvyl transferase
VSFAQAGGDRIGPEEQGGGRSIDHVAAVLERFGARVSTTGGLSATARRLRGCSMDLLDFSTDRERVRGPRTSSATKTALILAAAAEGTTRLRHPVDRDATRELCDFLRLCGATVSQEGDTWCVQAAASVGSVTHHLISDSTSIVTFIACAALAGGSLQLTGITRDRTRLAIVDELRVLAEMGVPVDWGPDWLCVKAPHELRPVDLEIECNGFSTDAHPILAVPLLRAGGVSRITDHVWTNRFAYVRLLEQMGAHVRVTGNTVELHPSELRPPTAPLLPTDSRAAAAAVVAAMGVDGATTIADPGHLDRSYEALVDRLCGAGASIEVSSAMESGAELRRVSPRASPTPEDAATGEVGAPSIVVDGKGDNSGRAIIWALPRRGKRTAMEPTALDLVIVLGDGAVLGREPDAPLALRVEAARQVVWEVDGRARLAFVGPGSPDCAVRPLMPVASTSDRQTLSARIEAATSWEGGPHYPSTLRSAIDALIDGDNAYGWPPYRVPGRTAGVLFLGDGRPRSDPRPGPDQQQIDELLAPGGVCQLLSQRGWSVSTIDNGSAASDAEPAAILREMARATGGRSFVATTPKELRAACGAVIAELSRTMRK